MRLKHGSVIIVVISLLFVLVLLFGEKNDMPDGRDATVTGPDTLHDPGVIIDTNAGQIHVDFIRKNDGTGKMFLFLPSFVKDNELTLSVDDFWILCFDGKRVWDGEKITLDNLPKIVTCTPAYTGWVDNTEYEFICMRSQNIPAVFIDTQKLSQKELDADKEVSDRAAFRAVDPDGSLDTAGNLELIRARGNSSFQAEKKSYRIKFSQTEQPFGMSAEKSFILQANAYDNTGIRNSLAYSMADGLGIAYTPKFTPVDFYFNGVYSGNYLFLESIKAGPGRVDIVGDDSYLFEVVHDEKRLDDEHFSFMSGGEIHLSLLYPEAPSEAEKEYIRSHMNRLDGMIEDLSSGDGLDELSRYADLDSFVNMFLFNFITDDIDAGNYSSYLYLDGRDGKVHLGPVWDYDKAWGNEKKKNAPPHFNAYSWRWPELPYDNFEYREMLRDRFPYVKGLAEHMLEQGIDEMSREIAASLEMDVTRNGYMAGQSVNTGSPEGDILQLKEYLRERLLLLDGVVNSPGEYCRVSFKGRSGRLFWVKRGECLSVEDISFAKNLYGCEGFEFADGKELTPEVPFNDDCVVKLK